MQPRTSAVNPEVYGFFLRRCQLSRMGVPVGATAERSHASTGKPSTPTPRRRDSFCQKVLDGSPAIFVRHPQLQARSRLSTAACRLRLGRETQGRPLRPSDLEVPCASVILADARVLQRQRRLTSVPTGTPLDPRFGRPLSGPWSGSAIPRPRPPPHPPSAPRPRRLALATTCQPPGPLARDPPLRSTRPNATYSRDQASSRPTCRR